MGKKTAAPPSGLEWDPRQKESWHLDFEQEPVNDDKWTCVVTAAVQAEAQEEECIQIFSQCASTGLRKAIKVLTMTDVVKLLRENGSRNASKKEEKPGKSESSSRLRPPPPRASEIVALAAKYATFTDVECKLPPDLMAAVLKYLILNLKDEHCFRKRVEQTRARRAREKEMRAQFVRDMKPYEVGLREGKSQEKAVPPNVLGLRQPIDDEPFGGPDLYVMLTDFYDLFCLTELPKIKVPFIALLKIARVREPKEDSHHSLPRKPESFGKWALVAEFWEKLKENCIALEKAVEFKDVAAMQYWAPTFTNAPSKQHVYRVIFDELSWMMYSAYCIHRQHRKYLRELHVQRLALSLERLDLSGCETYNKLCDALVTGEPNTPCLVLHAMVEQVVVGVPETSTVFLDYEPDLPDFFPECDSQRSSSDSASEHNFKAYDLLPPCEQCRGKKEARSGAVDQKSSTEDWTSERNDWTTTATTTEENTTGGVSLANEEVLPESRSSEEESKPAGVVPEEFPLPESLIAQVLSERQAGRGVRGDGERKAPRLVFHGDSIALQTFHCDPRILDPSTILTRFLKNSGCSSLWKKYPELPPEERAFSNYHFSSLRLATEETEETDESLKLAILFTLSMKLIGMMKSYLYKGEDKEHSEMVLGKEKVKKFSKVRFNREMLISHARAIGINFSSYFFKTFIVDVYLQTRKKTVFSTDDVEHLKESIHTRDSVDLHKEASQFNVHRAHRLSGTCHPYCFKTSESTFTTFSGTSLADKAFAGLHSLLDRSDISSLTETNYIGDVNDYLNIVQKFQFFEELEPELMVQRLLEAKESYNTVQCLYFAPTDSLCMLMQNDHDYRGLFFNFVYGALLTPVTLRDFYSHVYPEISDWLVDDVSEYYRFETELQEKAKELKEKREQEYLMELKRYFCQLSDEEKRQFLEADLWENWESEDDVLDELPTKARLPSSAKVSFFTTNFLDVRVETRRIVNEYHSQDGTEVKIFSDSWPYENLDLLSLRVKRSNMCLHYHQQRGKEEFNTSFGLRTASDIIFVFYKNEPEISSGFNYRLKMSWPVGLLIEGVPHETTTLYVKQGYLKVYRTGWDIREEKCRCHLRNGQVLIFKENGAVEILTASGTVHYLSEFEEQQIGASDTTPVLFSTCKTTTPCGEVHERTTKGPSRNKKKLLAAHKVYLGVDPKTEETFYKRDDGVQSMLWPSGKLVTKYPDGTKITSVPDFEEEEIVPEWSQEEKLFLSKTEETPEEAGQHKNSVILRKSSAGKTSSDELFSTEGFVSVSCSYLMEHPKYSSVRFSPKEPFVEVKMPEMLNVKMYPEGNYEVQREGNVLKVQDCIAEFYTRCSNCNGKSVATLNLDSTEVLFELVDFFQKSFRLQKNGETTFKDLAAESLEQVPSGSHPYCQHVQNVADKHRCFALERDLSGIEFLHADSLAHYCYNLSNDAHFELNCASRDSTLSHTFSNPHYKIGYETWLMEYEDKYDSLPTNLKGKDLREMGTKDNKSKLYVHPFPKNHGGREDKTKCKSGPSFQMPKIIVTRIVKGFSQEPTNVIEDLQKRVIAYQKKGHDIYKVYKSGKAIEGRSQDSRYVKMRLRKIALTLNQSLNMYPHLCTQFPSTEKDIHYFGHFINMMDVFKSHFQNDSDDLPDCKQIPRRLPRSSDFPCIYEESESPDNL